MLTLFAIFNVHLSCLLSFVLMEIDLSRHTNDFMSHVKVFLCGLLHHAYSM